MKKRNAVRRRKLCALVTSLALGTSMVSMSVWGAEDLLTSEPVTESSVTEEPANNEEILLPEEEVVPEENQEILLETENEGTGESATTEAAENPETSSETPSETPSEASPETPSDTSSDASNTAEDSSDLLIGDLLNDSLEDAEASEVGAPGSQNGTCGTNLTWSYSGGVLTVSGTGAMSSSPWTDSANDLSPYITKVVISDKVTSICSYAFFECTKLTNVSLGSSLKTIEDSAFKGCTALTGVKLPSSLTTLGSGAFLQSGLTSISVPGSVQKIEHDTFFECNSLKSVNLAEGIKSIESNAFQGCESLVSIAVPDTVTSMEAGVFKYCTALKTAKLSNGLSVLESQMFYGCTSLTDMAIPAKITEINHYAFYNCSSLSNLSMSDNVTRLEGYSFYGCSSLKKLYLSKSLFFIGHYAFARCTGLTDVFVPSSLKYVEEYAFSGCSSLANVVYGASITDWGNIYVDESNGYLLNANISYNSDMSIDKPVLSSPVLTTTGVRLTWGVVSGAAKYRVYYKIYGSDIWSKAGDTTDTTFTISKLSSGETYQFTVCCIDEPGTTVTSEFSTSKTLLFVAAPVISRSVLTTTGIMVKWTAVSGAAKYRVFYKEYGASTWQKGGDTTNTSFTVNGLSSGKTYVFTVRSMNSAASSYTSAYNTSGYKVRFVKAPVISSLSNAQKGITLKWGTCAGASKYRVFYKVFGTSSWIKAGDTTAASYTVTGLNSGTKYTFTVRCLNAAGTTFTSTYYPSGKSLLFLGTPTVTAAKASKGVTVKWKKISGASGYHIYRKTAGKSWTRIKTVSSGSTITYTDKTGVSGTRYYYTIRAYNGSVLGSYLSTGASAIAG